MRSVYCVVTLFAVVISVTDISRISGLACSLSWSLFSSTIKPLFSNGANRNVIIQHRKTGNFIAWYNNVPGTPITFTANDLNAQTFQMVMNDNGYFWFITSDGSTLLGKKGGCVFGSNYYIYDTDGNGDNKLFTLNNDYSIGSKCCNTCLLTPSNDNMLIEMDKFSCSTSNMTNFQFNIIPVDY